MFQIASRLNFLQKASTFYLSRKYSDKRPQPQRSYACKAKRGDYARTVLRLGQVKSTFCKQLFVANLNKSYFWMA